MGIAPMTKTKYRFAQWIRVVKIVSIVSLLALFLSVSTIKASNTGLSEPGQFRKPNLPLIQTGSSPLQTPVPGPVWTRFEAPGVSLAYPDDWQALPVQDAPQVVNQKGVCLLRLAHMPEADVVFSLAKRELASGENIQVEQADQQVWNSRTLGAMTLDALDALVLHSQAVVWVNGQRAIQRIYEYPLVDASSLQVTGKQFIYQVLVVDGKNVYQIEMSTRDAAAFERYTAIADGIVERLKFQHSAPLPRVQRQWQRFFSRPPQEPAPLRVNKDLDL